MKKLLNSLKPKLYLIGARYFLFWGRLVLKRWRPVVIVVTGSVGKTVLLNMLEVQFGKKAKYTHNANSAYGIAFNLVNEKGIYGSRLRWFYLVWAVPLKSLFTKHVENFYIVELDADRPHEAGLAAKVLQPDTVLWTTLSETHSINFEPYAKSKNMSVLDAVTEAYGDILQHTSGPVFVDAKNTKMKHTATERGSDVVAVQNVVQTYAVKKNSTSFKTKRGTFTFSEPMPQEIGLQLSYIESFLNRVEMPVVYDMKEMAYPPGRSTYFKAIKGAEIIDSSYNAHLQSMESVLKMFRSVSHKHKWLVFGDIIEQGERVESESEQLAGRINKMHLEKVVLVGKRHKKYLLPLLQDGPAPVIAFEEPKEALDYIHESIAGNELLLFKGSQYLEGIIKHLLIEPEDEHRLCRRGKKAQAAREHRGIG